MASRVASPLAACASTTRSREALLGSSSPAPSRPRSPPSREQASGAIRCATLFARDLEAARYTADRAFRQYDAADPANRLVAGELEARWNKALAHVAEVEAQDRGS